MQYIDGLFADVGSCVVAHMHELSPRRGWLAAGGWRLADCTVPSERRRRPPRPWAVTIPMDKLIEFSLSARHNLTAIDRRPSIVSLLALLQRRRRAHPVAGFHRRTAAGSTISVLAHGRVRPPDVVVLAAT